MVGPVGDDGHHRDSGTQREPDEALVTAEIHTVPLGPRSAGLPVPARVHEHGGVLLEGQVSLATAGGDHADAPQVGADDRDAEEQVVSERVGGALESPALQHGQPDHPRIGHVEEARVVPHHQNRPAGGQVGQSPHLG